MMAPKVQHSIVRRSPPINSGIFASKGRGMFFFYFNKLGWPGSIALSIALTLALFLAFRLFNG
jgi:hypothetical protein